MKISSFSPGNSDTSLLVLSAGWLALCSCLVVKHWELLTVFAAFCASFIMARLVSVVTDNKSCAVHATQVRQAVSVVMYTLALGCTWLSTVSPDFLALCLATGYLAFDHWYTALYCLQRKSTVRVLEDALTLSLLAIVLATVTTSTQLVQWRSPVTLWLTFQIGRQAVMWTAKSATTDAKASPSTPPSRDDLWYIQGQAYDLREFALRHPGGEQALKLGQGRPDCTALVLSYHPFSLSKVQKTLAKYRVDEQGSDKKDSTPRPTRDAFYEILCERVHATLQQQGIDACLDRAANNERVLYYGIVAVGVVTAGYFHIIRPNVWGSLAFAMTGWLLVALGHDAGHFAASRYAWINDWGLWGMSLMCNPMLWQHQHTYAHHSFTNDFEADPDVHHFQWLLRVHRRFAYSGLYENQRHLPFIMLAYAFVAFGECFWIPLRVLLEGSLYGVVEWSDRKRPWRAVAMYTHLAVYVALVLVAPFFAAKFWYEALTCVVIHVAASGLIFGFFSQINHLNETSIETNKTCATNGKDRHPITENSWAADQVEASNNFCPQSILWYYLSIGLNFQIEHHLFPGLNHCHLWRVAPTVKATCEEYGVNYKSFATWSGAWAATRSWLDQLAEAD